MIELKDLSCTINDTKILKNINLSFSRCGLVCILGNSGCGKTTLLNCTSGLLDYEGSLKIDGCEIKELEDNERALFRLKNIGFIFQDFKLLEHQTVFDNVALPLKTLTNMNVEKVLRRSMDLLEIVGLKDYGKNIVNHLSGGEKQRVAIARSFVNNPKVILADEPTGSLDSKNSIEIMKILKTLSKKALIICVTHDEELAKTYSDRVIRMSDGEIESSIEENSIDNNQLDLPFSEGPVSNKKPSLPFAVALKQVLKSFSLKKIRSSIGFIFMSLALLGIGLSIAFSNSISNNIKRSYEALIEDSQINLQKKNISTSNIMSLEEIEAHRLMLDYCDEIDGYGVVYKADFEAFFPDKNELSFISNNESYKLEGFSARDINEFQWLDNLDTDVFPSECSIVEEDEIILGLTIKQIRILCFGLGIDMNIQSLASYLENNTIPLVFEFANSNWEYWDELILNMKGFCLTNDPFLCSDDWLWNKNIFEDQMRFPTDETYLNSEYPWILNKLTYIRLNNIDKFLIKIHKDIRYNNLIFDLGDKKYFPSRDLNKKAEEIDRLVLFYGNDSYITSKELNYVKKADENLENETIFNSGGYVCYPQGLLNGFANRTYFSLDGNLLAETMEKNSSCAIAENEEEILPLGIVCSDFSKTFDNPVKFCSKYDKFLKGREPTDYSEIVISVGLLKLILDEDLTDDYLYISTVVNEINDDYGIYSREYVINTIKIVGITDNQKPKIYHNPYWTVDFYISKVGISTFVLLPNVVSYTYINENNKNRTVENLKRAFPQYSIINPLNDINESVDNLCNIISLFVLGVSFVSLAISIILLSTVHYLSLQDMRKDISLMRCIGINKQDSMKFLYCFSIVSSIISFLIASIELVITSAVLSLSLAEELSIDFQFSLEPFAFVAMAFVSFVLVIILSMMFGKKVTKIDPLECLRT